MRLKQKQIKPYREGQLELQKCKCKLCGEPLAKEDAVLDHSHKTGHIRGVLHRGCNALLGKIENNYRRLAVPNLNAFLGGLLPYILSTELDDLHPSYKTEDEKRIRRNKRAKKLRKLKKKQ